MASNIENADKSAANKGAADKSAARTLESSNPGRDGSASGKRDPL